MHKHVLAAMVMCSAMAAFACNRSDARRDENGNDAAKTKTEATRPSDAAPKPQPISVTGCLQKQGGDYIVTNINEPSSRPVATSGSSAGVGVQSEQRRAAAAAYRVSPSDDAKIDELVGKQVEVSGTIEERSRVASGETAATSGTERDATGRRAQADIKSDDLGRITAASMTKVADNCGKTSRKKSPRRAR
jgi:hypothetical protein